MRYSNWKAVKILFFCLLVFFYAGASAQVLVLRGDHPDPSVIKVGGSYWASSTTSNWAPAFPLMQSKDLLHWKLVSHVFLKLPEWADYYFWAPELSYENGKVYVYYAAHKKGGSLCIGVASADRPEGPFTDHGAFVCQESGSIDAFPMRDENGRLYLVWKEDANSVGKPTRIWAMEMDEARTKTIGEKKELFRNDMPWEMNLVEGVSMIRHGEYFYAFYAGAGCCGLGCNYGVGIARSKHLLGPWEKYSGNPVLTKDKNWNCPGHGTPVEKDGRHYFIYHAYDPQTTVFTGREGILSEYRFTEDGWIEFVKDSSTLAAPAEDVKDNFRGKSPRISWQWSVFQQPQLKQHGGELFLQAATEGAGNFIGQPAVSGKYTATVKVHHKKSTAIPGIALIGDEHNLLAALFRNDSVVLVRRKEGKETVNSSAAFRPGKKFYLRMLVRNSSEVFFEFSNNGKNYRSLNEKAVNGSFLPPWDRAVRIGITAKGEPGTSAAFDSFTLVNE